MTGAFARASLEPRGSAHPRGLGASLRVKPQAVLGGTQQRVESVPTSSQGPGSSAWYCLACCVFWDGGSPSSPHLLTQCLESCGESWEMGQTGLGLRPARVALGQSPALSEPGLHTWGVDVRRQEVTVEGCSRRGPAAGQQDPLATQVGGVEFPGKHPPLASTSSVAQQMPLWPLLRLWLQSLGPWQRPVSSPAAAS